MWQCNICDSRRQSSIWFTGIIALQLGICCDYSQPLARLHAQELTKADMQMSKNGDSGQIRHTTKKP